MVTHLMKMTSEYFVQVIKFNLNSVLYIFIIISQTKDGVSSISALLLLKLLCVLMSVRITLCESLFVVFNHCNLMCVEHSQKRNAVHPHVALLPP